MNTIYRKVQCSDRLPEAMENRDYSDYVHVILESGDPESDQYNHKRKQWVHFLTVTAWLEEIQPPTEEQIIEQCLIWDPIDEDHQEFF